MKGILGNMFDFDGNGDLDSFEKGAEMAFLYNMFNEMEKENSDDEDEEDD